MLTVWSMPGCIWCVKVCELLADLGIPFEKHEPPLVELRVMMREKGLTTLPQVFTSEGRLIGGYEATREWVLKEGANQ